MKLYETFHFTCSFKSLQGILSHTVLIYFDFALVEIGRDRDAFNKLDREFFSEACGGWHCGSVTRFITLLSLLHCMVLLGSAQLDSFLLVFH